MNTWTFSVLPFKDKKISPSQFTMNWFVFFSFLSSFLFLPSSMSLFFLPFLSSSLALFLFSSPLLSLILTKTQNVHSKLLDDLDSKIDKTSYGIEREIRHITKVSESAKVCGMWISFFND